MSLEAAAQQVPGKLAAARAANPASSYAGWKAGWAGGLLISTTKPGSRAVRTSPRFVPVTVGPEVVKRFLQQHETLKDWIRAADGPVVTRNRTKFTVLSSLSYHLGDCLTINTVHAERHLQQADRVKAKPGFPTR